MANTKKPKYYFSYNDGTPSEELADCIITEAENAGLVFYDDEYKNPDYDYSYSVHNPAADKLEKIKKILKTNIKIWDESQHDPVEEFKLLVEMIEEKE
jgi:hypothetical protein